MNVEITVKVEITEEITVHTELQEDITLKTDTSGEAFDLELNTGLLMDGRL